ncbi:hypothetical protein AFLA70_857g000110 [Aspergillus flavus AF70]|nr:hypothetical protein AFLA70_857g000110 [Aspergillus flavus AF70]
MTPFQNQPVPVQQQGQNHVNGQPNMAAQFPHHGNRPMTQVDMTALQVLNTFYATRAQQLVPDTMAQQQAGMAAPPRQGVNSANVSGAQQAPGTMAQPPTGMVAPHGKSVNLINGIVQQQVPSTMVPLQAGIAGPYGPPVYPINAVPQQEVHGTMVPLQTGIAPQYQHGTHLPPSQGLQFSPQQHARMVQIKEERMKEAQLLEQNVMAKVNQKVAEVNQKNEMLHQKIEEVCQENKQLRQGMQSFKRRTERRMCNRIKGVEKRAVERITHDVQQKINLWLQSSEAVRSPGLQAEIKELTSALSKAERRIQDLEGWAVLGRRFLYEVFFSEPQGYVEEES